MGMKQYLIVVLIYTSLMTNDAGSPELWADSLLSEPPGKPLIYGRIKQIIGLPRELSGKESACNAGDVGSIPGSGRSPEVGNGNPLQYSCLENFIDRGAWWATVHGVAKSQKQPS